METKFDFSKILQFSDNISGVRSTGLKPFIGIIALVGSMFLFSIFLKAQELYSVILFILLIIFLILYVAVYFKLLKEKSPLIYSEKYEISKMFIEKGLGDTESGFKKIKQALKEQIELDGIDENNG